MEIGSHSNNGTPSKSFSVLSSPPFSETVCTRSTLLWADNTSAMLSAEDRKELLLPGLMYGTTCRSPVKPVILSLIACFSPKPVAMVMIITTMDTATALTPIRTTLLDNPAPLCREKRRAMKDSKCTDRQPMSGTKGIIKRALGLLISLIFQSVEAQQLLPGAARWEAYQDLLEGKNVGVIAHQSSLVDSLHLIDFLLDKGVNVQKVFAPEHGFRGRQAAGAKIADGKDVRTGLPIVSLYGKNRRPTAYQLKGST